MARISRRRAQFRRGRTWALCLVLGCAAGLSAAQEAPTLDPVPDIQPTLEAAVPVSVAEIDAPVLPTRTRRYTLEQLGGRPSETLRGVEGIFSWPFGIRLDETVVGASLKLQLIASPALISRLSHIRVAINGEVIHVVRLSEDELGEPISRTIPVDPGYFSDYNELTLRLIGHYTEDCEDPNHSSLWATISGDSVLELQTRPLGLAPDLALLPVPFFDPRDGDRLQLPVVLPENAGPDALKAAGIIASHFGALADYRSARFPVAVNALPDDSHAVVLIDNDNASIPGLRLGPTTKPTVKIRPNPNAPNKRLLILQSPEPAGWVMAASGAVLGGDALTGTVAQFEAVERPESTRWFDGPRWVPTQRAAKLADLIEDPLDLEVSGHAPVPIVVNLRVPPDLFLSETGRIPMRLGYRYTPPLETDNSMLTVSINDQIVRSMPLEPIDSGTGLIPGATPDEPFSVAKLPISNYMIGSDNQLRFQFGIDHHKPGPCRDSGADLVRSGLNPDSTIDFSGIAHYTAMPNLGHFANAGYPFTRYADLQDLALIMSDAPAASEIELMLFLLGRIGRMNGTAGHSFSVVPASNLKAAKSRDLLVLAPQVLNDWGKDLAASIAASRRSVTPTQRLKAAAQRFWAGEDAPVPPWRVTFDAEGSLAALMGFESPLQSGRSAVAIASSDVAAQALVIEALERPDRVDRVRGDLVFFRATNIDAYRTQPPYFVGSLAWHQWIAYHLGRMPGWTILIAIFAVFLIAVLLYGFYRRAAERRQAG